MNRLQRYSNGDPVDFPPPPPPLQEAGLFSPSPARVANFNYNNHNMVSHVDVDSFPLPPPPPSSLIGSSSSTFQPQPSAFTSSPPNANYSNFSTQHSSQLRSAPKFSPPKPLPLSPKPILPPQAFGQSPPTTPFTPQHHQQQASSPSPSSSSAAPHMLQRNLSRASDRSSLSLNLEDLSRALTFLDNATLELELFSQLSPNSLLFQDGEPLFTTEEIEKLFNGHAAGAASSGTNTLPSGHRMLTHTASHHQGTRFDFEPIAQHQSAQQQQAHFQKTVFPGHPAFPGQYSTISGPYLAGNVDTRKTLIEPNSSAAGSSLLSKNRSFRAQSMLVNRPQDGPGSGIQPMEAFKRNNPLEVFEQRSAEFNAGRTAPTKVSKSEAIHYGSIWIYQHIAEGKIDNPKKGKKTKNGYEAYGILTKDHLLLYKNEKSAFEGLKNIYHIALIGASVSWDLSNKPFRFKLATFGNEFLLHHTKEESAKLWFSKIEEILNAQPKITGFQRNNSLYKAQNSRTDSPGTSTPPSDRKIFNIREKLKQLLRFRPTVDTLKEKGIFREELIFNRSLDELCLRDQHCVPRFVRECVEAIEKKDMKAEGLYRACGNLSSVQKLRFDINLEKYQALYAEDDVHVLTGLLKMFFRTMAEPLFPSDKFSALLNIIDLQCTDTEKIRHFQETLSHFPANNLETIRFILEHLLRVIQFSRDNRMNIQNLAIVFGPTLLRPKEDSKNLFIDMSSQINQCRIVEFLLKHFPAIFDSIH